MRDEYRELLERLARAKEDRPAGILRRPPSSRRPRGDWGSSGMIPCSRRRATSTTSQYDARKITGLAAGAVVLTACQQHRAEGQDRTAAMVMDRAADFRRGDACNQERYRQSATTTEVGQPVSAAIGGARTLRR